MNSYVTIEEANDYMASRIGSNAWYDTPELPYPIAEFIVIENTEGVRYQATATTQNGQTTISIEPYSGNVEPVARGTWVMLDQDGALFQVTLTSEESVPQFEISKKQLTSERMKGLVTATRAVDRLNFKGTKAVTGQSNQFPRGDSSVVPDNIKIATMEEALSLLEGRDPNMEYEGLRMLTQTYANVKSSFDPRIIAEHILNGITSTIAWRYLKPYIRSQTTMRVERA